MAGVKKGGGNGDDQDEGNEEDSFAGGGPAALRVRYVGIVQVRREWVRVSETQEVIAELSAPE